MISPSTTSNDLFLSLGGTAVISTGLLMMSSFPIALARPDSVDENQGSKDSHVLSSSDMAYNVIFRRDVSIAALHKFVAEIKKRSASKEYPDFHVTVDKVLTNMKLIKIINPSPTAWKFITSQKIVKEYYETPAVTNEDTKDL